QSVLHQAGCARTCSARACRSTTSSGSGSASAESADTAAGSALYNAGIYAAESSSGLGAEGVCVGDRQVVAGDCEIEIVLQSELDGIFKGEVEFAVPDQLGQAWRICKLRLGDFVSRICAERIMRARHIKG